MATGDAGRGEEIPSWLYTLLVVAGQIIGLSLIIAIGARDAGRAVPGAYAFACGFGAVLLLRGRYPLAVLVVTVLGIFGYYILGYPPIGMAVPAAAALYATAARGRAVAGLVSGFVLLAVSLYFRAAQHESSAVLAYDVLTNAALVGCAVALGLNVRGRRRLRAQQATIVDLERSREQERAARERQAERVRVARDLHDSVGHALSVISVHANVAREAIGDGNPPAERALGRVIDATATSLRDLRATLSTLRSPGDGDDRTPVTLAGIDQVARAARDVGLDVHAAVDTGGARVPAPVASAAYRIVQEAVTNVLRHASATTLTIEVTAESATLRVRVADDGHGASPPDAEHRRSGPPEASRDGADEPEAGPERHGAPDAGLGRGGASLAGDRAGRGGAVVRAGRGLAGMRERATALGGTFHAADGDEGGFVVTATLPLPPGGEP